MTIERALTGIVKSSSAVYVEDVFSTYLYTGNGTSQTITNGIDLSTNGGLVWTKTRNAAYQNILVDSVRGVSNILYSDTTGAQSAASDITSFTTTGYTLQHSNGGFNRSAGGEIYASWTFRKQAKFFDVVTYTGNGSSKTVPHNLGCKPGLIIVKCVSAAGYNGVVYHKSLSATTGLYINTSDAKTVSSVFWNDTEPTSTGFTLGYYGGVNQYNNQYVAYLFADSNSGGFGAAGTDSVVACGTWSGIDTVNLGWEPQFVLIKRSNGVGNWYILDNMRGFVPTPVADKILYANTTGAELDTPWAGLTSTGFTTDYIGAAGETYIYLAIRRGPMKTPTDATKVYAPILGATDSSGTIKTTGFPIDTQWIANRSGNSYNTNFNDRLRGVSTTSTASGKYLISSSTAAEASTLLTTQGFDNTGFKVSSDYGGVASVIYHNFRRAPGFFDVVCFRGTGAAQYVSHNLGVSPQLIIIKNRTGSAYNWAVWSSVYANGRYNNYLDNNQAVAQNFEFNLSTTNPNTSTTFYLQWGGGINTNNVDYVAYLFATCPGVSKVGSYTGNGTSQTVNCGFASGARFVLIKRTDSTGDWYVWDTARGIVSANDPHLSLNTTSAEVTTDDTIDPDSTGFIVNQVAATNVNVSSAIYIYLAIA